MATLVPVDHDPFAEDGQQGPQASSQLPNYAGQLANALQPQQQQLQAQPQPQQQQPPQQQPQRRGGFGPGMSPELLMKAEIAGLVPAGAAKVVTENPQYQIEQRRQAAQQMKLDPEDPATHQYVLTGSYPKHEQDHNAIGKAQDKIDSLDVTLADAKKAKDLAGKAITGPIPQTRAWLGSWYDDPASVATQRYENLAGQLSQQVAKSLSGGRVSKFEQSTQKDLLGGLSKGIESRKATIQDMVDLLEQERGAQSRNVDQLRNGTFYKPQRQQSTPLAPHQLSDDELKSQLGIK